MVVLWYILLIVVIVRVFLRENRTPASRIAWILVVALLPYLGVFFYILLGETNLGRKYNKRLEKTLDALFKQFRRKEGGDWSETRPHLREDKYANVFSYTCSISGLEPTFGNKAELMADADENLSRLIADVDNATTSFHGLYYIWIEDHTGTALAEALIRASKRGVKCRVMADAVGSRKFVKSKTWKAMIEAGVDARIALPLKYLPFGFLAARLDLRNHRKITVIDNEITYIGSQNMADPAFVHKAEFAPWVDIMARFEGPVVKQNNLLFISDWMMISDEKAEDLFDEVPEQIFEGGFVANIAPDGPTLRYGAIPQLFETIFSAAQEEVFITSPYFVPTEGLVDSICALSYSGVKVTMMLPKNNDSVVVGAASKSYYKELLLAGVKIYEYKPGLLHSKIITVDGKLSMIGSSNLDRRSFDLNYENNIVFEDEAMTLAIQERQKEYIADSDEVQLSEVEDWSAWTRFRNNFMAMLSPIL